MYEGVGGWGVCFQGRHLNTLALVSLIYTGFLYTVVHHCNSIDINRVILWCERKLKLVTISVKESFVVRKLKRLFFRTMKFFLRLSDKYDMTSPQGLSLSVKT